MRRRGIGRTGAQSLDSQQCPGSSGVLRGRSSCALRTNMDGSRLAVARGEAMRKRHACLHFSVRRCLRSLRSFSRSPCSAPCLPRATGADTVLARSPRLSSSTTRRSVQLRPTWVLPGNQFPTRAQVTYRGDSHPIDSTRREIVRRWGLSYLRDSSIAATYHREYLFQEGRHALWLPVQDKVASFFPRELQSGQTVTLYVLWLGAHYAGGDVTWAFVVTEFDTDTTKR